MNDREAAPDNLTPKRNPAGTPYRSTAPVSRKCSVCRSPNLDTINRMLLGNMVKQDNEFFTLQDIAQWSRQTGSEVSKAALSRHLNNHLSEGQPPEVLPVDTARDRLSQHIKKAAEALVQSIYEQVAFEVAEAAGQTVRPVLPARFPTPGPAQEAQEETAPPIPARAPRQALQKAVRVKGARAMPRDFQAALKLEQALNRIQLMPLGTRARVVQEVAEQYGTGAATVRRWLAQYEQHGLGGITAIQRADKGQGRLPAEQVRQLLEVIDQWPTLSIRKVYALLKEKHPELLQYEGRNKAERTMSSASIGKLVKQARAAAG